MKDFDRSQAFDIDDRIKLHLERELAIQLGLLILDTDTQNKALLALAHKLYKLRKDQVEYE